MEARWADEHEAYGATAGEEASISDDPNSVRPCGRRWAGMSAHAIVFFGNCSRSTSNDRRTRAERLKLMMQAAHFCFCARPQPNLGNEMLDEVDWHLPGAGFGNSTALRAPFCVGVAISVLTHHHAFRSRSPLPCASCSHRVAWWCQMECRGTRVRLRRRKAVKLRLRCRGLVQRSTGAILNGSPYGIREFLISAPGVLSSADCLLAVVLSRRGGYSS